MSSNMIQAAASWEGDASLKAICLDELAHCVLKRVAHVRHVNAGLDDAPHVLPHLLHIASLFMTKGSLVNLMGA